MMVLTLAVSTLTLSQTQNKKAPPSLKVEQSKPSSESPQKQLPKGWSTAGSHPQDYEIGLDTTEKHSGQASAYIKLSRFKFKSEGFGALTQMFKADDYKGRRVRLSAYVKAENIEEYAGLWMRVDGVNRMLGFDNMQNRPITGTTGWTKYEVVLDVPETSVNIAFGLLLRGAGRAWVDNFQFEVVGQDVPTTNRLPPQGIEDKGGASREYPSKPTNLDFEM